MAVIAAVFTIVMPPVSIEPTTVRISGYRCQRNGGERKWDGTGKPSNHEFRLGLTGTYLYANTHMAVITIVQWLDHRGNIVGEHVQVFVMLDDS